MIRPARFADTPSILALIGEMHERSVYAGVDTVDGKVARSIVVQSVQRHGLLKDGGASAFVAEQDNEIVGFIIGVLDRLYHIGHRLMATDLLFYAGTKAGPRDFVGLFDAFEAWAESVPGIAEIKPGITDAIDEPERLAKFYERRGYRRCGAIFQRSIER